MRRVIPKLALSLAAVIVALLLSETFLRVYLWSKGVGRSDVTRLLHLSAQTDTENIEAYAEAVQRELSARGVARAGTGP